MAEIYNQFGEEITVGLPSTSVCDYAIQAAKRIACEQQDDVFLEDGASRLTVSPDGTVTDGWEGDWNQG